MSISVSTNTANAGSTININYDAYITPTAPNYTNFDTHTYYIAVGNSVVMSCPLSVYNTEHVSGTYQYTIPWDTAGTITISDYATGTYPPTNSATTYSGNSVSITVYSSGTGGGTTPTNTPPTTPSGITAQQVGRQLSPNSTWTAKWTASTDSDGDVVFYIPQFSYNGNTWYDIDSTYGLSATVNATNSPVYFRVRACDGKAYSDYRTSAAYTPIFNTAPPTPTGLTVPTSVMSGASLAFSCNAVTDPDGDTVYYKAEISTNGGSSWSQIYQGTSNSGSYTAPSASSAQLRMKAYDSYGAESAWVTSSTITIVNNSAPNIPPYINVPSLPKAGSTGTITWGAVSDPDNNLAGYILERSVNGGAWTEIKRGNVLSFVDTFGSWASFAYRVCAYDSYGLKSGYRTSSTSGVDTNTAPVISCSQSGNIGTKSADFTVAYTVTDTDNDSVTVKEELDSVLKRTYTATLGQANTFDVSGEYFMCILNGSHTLKITATDSKGKSTALALTFTKSVHALSITLAEPLPSDTAITKMVMSITKNIPSGANFTVEVTNNANDDTPVWEDVTAKVNQGLNHVFTNAAIVNANGFNFKITASRAEDGDGNTIGDGGYISLVKGAYQ